MAGPTNPIMSPDAWSQYIEDHGGTSGVKEIGSATTTDPITHLPSRVKYPDIRFDFKDGTYSVAHLDPTQGVAGGSAWVVTDPGTASKPPKAPSGTAPTTKTDPNTGITYEWDPDKRSWAPAVGIPAAPPQDKPQQPKVLVSGSSTSDPFLIFFDPNTNTTSKQDNPNYRNPATAPLSAADAARIPIEQQNADTSRQNANTSAQDATLQAARDQVDARYKDISSQVAQGRLSQDAAIQQFKEVVDSYNAQKDALAAGQLAGEDAVKNVQAQNANRVGPGFGANFARGLQGVATADPSKVSYGPNDFTYPTPDYNGIAAKYSAAALAHLSPYAAQIAQQHVANQPVLQGGTVNGGNVATTSQAPYTPPPSSQPSVLATAAAQAVSQVPYRPQTGR